MWQETHNAPVLRAYDRLINVVIPTLAADLNDLCAGSGSHCEPATRDGKHLLGCGCWVGNDGLSRLVQHSVGVKPRLVLGDAGYLGPSVPSTLGDDLPRIISESGKSCGSDPLDGLAPGVVRRASSSDDSLSLQWSDVPFNPSSIIMLLHSRGINMRHCGRVLELVSCDLWRRRLLLEMVARTLKGYLRHEHRHEMKVAKIATSEAYRLLLIRKVPPWFEAAVLLVSHCLRVMLHCVALQLNRVFGGADSAGKFWDEHVLPRMRKTFETDFIDLQSRERLLSLRACGGCVWC